jgi:hypothetical protein
MFEGMWVREASRRRDRSHPGRASHVRKRPSSPSEFGYLAGVSFATPKRKAALATLLLLSAATACMAAGRVPSLRSEESAPPCTAPAYHQFDFWAGDWDAFDFGNPAVPVARVHVERILDGCVLREDYQAADGTMGQSFTIYDETRGLWHQTWVTNRGRLLTIEGKLEAGAMILSGSDLTVEGKARLIRCVWKPVDGGVRETAVLSMDGARTWTPWFDLIFRTHKP